MSTGHRPFSARRTTVVVGDWDRRPIVVSFASERQVRERVDYAGVARLEQYAFFTSVVDHFEHGVPWEETEFYQYKLESTESGHYESKEKLDRRFGELSDLYESMRQAGYKSQRELQNVDSDYVPLGKDFKSPPERGEVAVAIGRDGEILHVDGRHRLTVARLLEINEIPVRVVARHAKWQQLRKRVATASGPGEVLKQTEVSVDHPDLRGLVE